MIQARPRASAPRLAVVPSASPREAMPPFALPAEHFAAGLAWVVVGAAGLVVTAPTLAAGGFLAPHVIAVTHCFTLGWITTSIFGVLHQVYPVALGVRARSTRLGHVTFWSLQAGTMVLVAGTWFWRPPLLATGWIFLVLAVGGQWWNIVSRGWRAPKAPWIGLYVAGGFVALWGALAVVAEPIGVELGWWAPLSRVDVLAAHAHLAALGFATVIAVGVGSRLVPMFLMSRGHPEWPLWFVGPAVGGGVLLLVIGLLLGLPTVIRVGAVTATAGVGAYLYLFAAYLRGRTRRIDPALALFGAAAALLAVTLVLGQVLLWRTGFDPRLAGAYGLAGVCGWLSLLAVGVYHKVVPFLTWLHRYGARAGEPGVPRVSDMGLTSLAWLAFGLCTAGIALLIPAVGLGWGAVATLGAAFFAAGIGATALQFGRLAVMR